MTFSLKFTLERVFAHEKSFSRSVSLQQEPALPPVVLPNVNLYSPPRYRRLLNKTKPSQLTGCTSRFGEVHLRASYWLPDITATFNLGGHRLQAKIVRQIHGIKSREQRPR